MQTITDNIFDNTEIAYKRLSNNELKKSYFLFLLMKNATLVHFGNQIIQFLLKINFPILGIVKKTIYSHFCGGETLEESQKTILDLSKNNIETLLNYSVEGLENTDSFKETYLKTLEAIDFAKLNQSIRAICIKFTGFARIDIWIKLQKGEALNTNEEEEYQKALEYIQHLSQKAVENNVQLYIDAEESWFQDSIDKVAIDLMLQYNKEKAFIFNTYQLYRSDKLEHLKRDIEWAKTNQIQLGAKIVRGAYVEKENEYARKNNIVSPIHKTKQDTDQDFNKAIEYCIHNINNVSLCCASHNEYSNQLLIQLLQENNISLDHPNISASQLQGMSDNITYNMSQKGIKMSKYLPYGPVKEVIPYLIRRSQENTSVEGQTSREFDLLLQEKNRRNL